MINVSRLPVLHSRFSVTDICAIALIIIGFTAILGWAFEIQTFTSLSWQTDYPTLKVNSSLGLIMLGIGLMAIRRQQQLLLIFTLLALSLIAFGALYEHLTGTELGINTLFFNDPWSASKPGLMSQASALAFVLAALLLTTHSTVSAKHPQIYSLIQLSYLTVPLIAFNAYLLEEHGPSHITFFETFSIPATLGFTLFFIGLVGATKGGVSALLRGNNHTSKAYRHTILTVGLIAMLLSVITNYAIQQQFIDIIAAIALAGSTMFVVMLFLISASYDAFHQRESLYLRQIEEALEPLSTIDKIVLDIFAEADDAFLLVNEQRRIVRANRGACNLFDWPQDELEGKMFEQLVPERFRVSDINLFYDFLASKEISRSFDKKGKILGLTRRGYEKALSMSIYKTANSTPIARPQQLIPRAQDKLEHSTYVIAMIQELSGLESEILDRHLNSDIDHLTGLPNIKEFKNTCAHYQRHEQRYREENLCIMLVDIDNFDHLNQRYEPDFGNQVIQTVAATLKTTLRTSDKLFRFNESNFVIIATNRDADDAELVAERIRTAIKVAPTRLNNKNIYTTCSVSVICIQNQKPDIQACVNHLLAGANEKTEHGDSVKIVDYPFSGSSEEEGI